MAQKTGPRSSTAVQAQREYEHILKQLAVAREAARGLRAMLDGPAGKNLDDAKQIARGALDFVDGVVAMHETTAGLRRDLRLSKELVPQLVRINEGRVRNKHQKEIAQKRRQKGLNRLVARYLDQNPKATTAAVETYLRSCPKVDGVTVERIDDDEGVIEWRDSRIPDGETKLSGLKDIVSRERKALR